MKKLIIPITLFILSGVVWTLFTLAKKDIVFGFFRPPQSIEWNEQFPNYMRIKPLLFSRWDDYPSLYEQCLLNRKEIQPDAKGSLDHVKKLITLAGIMGEMRQYLAARQFEAIVIMILSAWWMLMIIRRNTNRAEQSGPAYPPHGVGSADP